MRVLSVVCGSLYNLSATGLFKGNLFISNVLEQHSSIWACGLIIIIILQFMMAGAALVLVLVCLCSYVACFKELYLNKIDGDVAEGRYVSSADLGISFDLTSTSLSIFDLFGNEVLVVQETLHYQQQWIRIMGNTFVQFHVSEMQGYRDYHVPKFMYEEANYMSRQLNATVLELLEAIPSYHHHDNLLRSVIMLLESPFVDPIKSAAYALGNNLKLEGDTYPSLLPFYLVANMLEQLQVTGLLSNSSRMIKKNDVRAEECFEECPPCPDEECLSLCGYGCHCWKWVCGDCCYHLGCHGHDICCRKNFIQTKCLFPISFKCESEYSC